MVTVKAFKGYRYNPEKVSIQNVISPPYDVIDDKMKKRLTSLSPCNFVNVILNDDHNSAGDLLDNMIEEEVMVQDKEDSLYVYEQGYSINNEHHTRTGFICLLKLEDFGKNVLPHEKTFNKYIHDRLDLMAKTKADVGQIFMVYEDEKNEIDILLNAQKSGNEDMAYVDHENIGHKIWKIRDPETISKIISLMSNRILLMADGHHRYKTALQYHRDNPGNGYVMTTLVNSYNEGLVILPTNRVLNISVDINDFKEHFHIEKLSKIQTEFESKSFIVAGTKNSYKITLIDEHDEDLDIALLHDFVFKKILKLSDEQLKYPNIEFVKGNENTIKRIQENKTAFFVNPPTLQQTFSLAKSGGVMPQKSTYFYPKVFSGFVINRWGQGNGK